MPSVSPLTYFLCSPTAECQGSGGGIFGRPNPYWRVILDDRFLSETQLREIVKNLDCMELLDTTSANADRWLDDWREMCKQRKQRKEGVIHFLKFLVYVDKDER